MSTNAYLSPSFPTAGNWQGDRTRVGGRVSLPLVLQRVARDVILICGLLLLNKAGNVGAGVFFAILTLMVSHSPSAAFKALAICWLGLMINPSFVPKTLVWTPARLALPLVAFFRFSFDLSRIGETLLKTPMYGMFLIYVVIMAACSFLSGWYTQIALMKLVNFWAVISAILAGVLVLRRSRVDMTEWFVSLIGAATLLGLLSIAIGVDNNFRLYSPDAASNVFVGAFLHPNCHSVYASLFVVFLASLYLLGDYPRRSIVLPMIAIWIVFMIWSKARASVAATVVGFLVLLILAQPFRNRFGWRLRLNLSRLRMLAYLLLVGLFCFALDMSTQRSITKSVVAFINKGGDDAALTEIDTEQVLASRQSLINYSWNNFQDHWLTGIGFQVATTEVFIRNATLFTAPAEKGFLPTAVLEEGGVVGATAFVLLLLVWLSELFASRNIPAIAMLFAFLASNMAEVTMFSPGGSGAFGWTMIGAAMILGDHCWHRPRQQAGPLHY